MNKIKEVKQAHEVRCGEVDTIEYMRWQTGTGNNNDMLNKEDVMDVIGLCNIRKGLSLGWFDGRILRYRETKDKIEVWILGFQTQAR